MVQGPPLRPVEESCYWLAHRSRDESPALAGDLEADVAIIGAGFTGLWTAVALRELEPGLGIVILDKERVAHGASGRNAGIVGETLDHSPELAIAHFGLAEARRLARLGRENLDGMAAFLRERGIDAGFERPGQLVAALQPRHIGELKGSIENAHRVGLEDWAWLSREEVESRVRSPLPLGALLAPRNALLDPMRLAEGLAREAKRLGVRICEQTPVRRLERSPRGVRVLTAGGTIDARHVTLATNAYSHHLWPSLRRRFLPLYDYVVVSDPLTAAHWETVGWRGGPGLTDGRAFFNYARPLADGRILWGTSEAVYYGGNYVGVDADHSPQHYRGLEESFRRFFPQLSGIGFPFAWGGPIASTTRLTPFFGRLLGGRVSYALGYTGHGIGTTRLAGRILAHLALGRPSELLELAMVRRPPLPYPPEPLRRLAVGAVTRSLRRLDAGGAPDFLLRLLAALGIGFSS
jgi:glycine/D-amino acid oxidase-like deaminating enzyme